MTILTLSRVLFVEILKYIFSFENTHDFSTLSIIFRSCCGQFQRNRRASKMTISYNSAMSSVSALSFLKLMGRWKGIVFLRQFLKWLCMELCYIVMNEKAIDKHAKSLQFNTFWHKKRYERSAAEYTFIESLNSEAHMIIWSTNFRINLEGLKSVKLLSSKRITSGGSTWAHSMADSILHRVLHLSVLAHRGSTKVSILFLRNRR